MRNRVFASSKSARGVFCDFLMKPCNRIIRRSPVVNKIRATQNSRDAIGQADADFPQTFVEFANERHSERLAELHGLDVFADDSAVFTRE